MRLTKLRKGLIWLPLLGMSFTSLAPAAVSANSVTAAESRQLLKEIGWLSGKLRTDADTLESYKRQPSLSWQTHAAQLTQVKEHINAIGDRLERLQALRMNAAPWQQRAIDDIVPVAATLAAHTESAIQHLNENRKLLHAGLYADHLTSLSARSDELKASVDTYLDFASTSDELNRLQQKLNGLEERIGLLDS
jgi:DNA repair exonuclease SbcCD ATPase subunit